MLRTFLIIAILGAVAFGAAIALGVVTFGEPAVEAVGEGEILEGVTED
ncbi:hypothetical protein [Hasllibacter halocynthiae]|nr:hypothetical protein [Hasllibacter halocynthiae]